MAKISVRSRYLQAELTLIRQYPVGESNPKNFIRVDRVWGRRATTTEDHPESAQYRLQDGDTYQLLAWRYYKDPTLWYVIADANPSIYDVTALPAGVIIQIPPSNAVTETNVRS